ncbi:hypothetical protein D3C86_2108670 [compost metagenome]
MVSQYLRRSASWVATSAFTFSSMAFWSPTGVLVGGDGSGCSLSRRGRLGRGLGTEVFTLVACWPSGGCAPKWVTPWASTHL